MTDTLSRDYLLKRMDELLPQGDFRTETLKWAATAADDQLESWVAETELSQAFWEKWDKDMAADLAKKS